MRARVEYIEKIIPSYENTGSGQIYACCVGNFLRGAVNTPQIPGDRNNFLQLYTPNNTVGIGYATAYYSVLKAYEGSGNIVTVRAAVKDAYCANLTLYAASNKTAMDGTSYANKHENDDYDFLNGESLYIRASDRGNWGNDLSIQVYNYKEIELVKYSNSSITSTQSWGDGFPVRVSVQTGSLPTELSTVVTYYVANSGGTLKLHLTPADAFKGLNPVSFTGTGDFYMTPVTNYTKTPKTFAIVVSYNGEVKKTYVVSKDQSMVTNGSTYYVEDVINNDQFIKVQNNLFVEDPYLRDILEPLYLTQGSDGSPIKTEEMIAALDCVADNTHFNIKMMMDGGYTDVGFHTSIIQQCEKNKARIAVLSPPTYLQQQASSSTEAAQNIVNWRNLSGNYNSSYGVMYAPHQKIYDEFNSRYIYVAPDGIAVANIFKTAANYAIWYPPAGNKRGIVNSLDCLVRFNDPDQDNLYDNNINPIIYDAARGIKVWGQKTLKRASAVDDRLNVRLLLITIGPDLTKAFEDFVFDFNTTTTRASAVALVKSYMDIVKANNGVYDYRVVCDETNNSNSDIKNHIMRILLLVCPTSSIEEIPFTLGVTDTTVTFDIAQTLV